jgi:hypothetical protein
MQSKCGARSRKTRLFVRKKLMSELDNKRMLSENIQKSVGEVDRIHYCVYSLFTACIRNAIHNRKNMFSRLPNHNINVRTRSRQSFYVLGRHE